MVDKSIHTKRKRQEDDPTTIRIPLTRRRLAIALSQTLSKRNLSDLINYLLQREIDRVYDRDTQEKLIGSSIEGNETEAPNVARSRHWLQSSREKAANE